MNKTQITIMKTKEKVMNFINRTNKEKNNDNKPKIIMPIKDVPSMPKLVIDDLTLQVAIAQWLGILNSSISKGTRSFFFISHLDASELIKRSPYFVDSTIKEIDLKAAIIRFANLLSMTEIQEYDTCILNNFNEKELTFDCKLLSTGEILRIGLSYGSIDDLPEIRMTGDKSRRIYEYHYPSEDRDERIELSSYANQIDDNNLQFNRYVSNYTYYGHLIDDENKIDIEIGYPKSLEDTTNNIYIDEKLLEVHLNALRFPITIDEACKVIADALRVTPEELKYINVAISKKEENNKFRNTQIANFRDGEMTRFWIEKNGKVIDITNFGPWKHSNEQYTVSKNKEDKMNLECKNISVDTLDQIFNPREAITTAQKEVEEVRKLSKNIFKKHNK